MASKKERLKAWRLYVIADRAAAAGRDLETLVARAIEGGADVIQYRDKTASDREMTDTARRLARITRAADVPLLINDRIAVAHACGAGVHLGQKDAPLDEARRALGNGAIVGRSTHSAEQGMAAEAEGFDYIGVGPVFATPTKPDYLPAGLEYVKFAAENIGIPFVAIGGIDASNVGRVVEAGARAVAVVRAVIGADDPKTAAENLVHAISDHLSFPRMRESDRSPLARG